MKYGLHYLTKLIVLLLISSLCVLIISCGNTDSEDVSEVTSAQSETAIPQLTKEDVIQLLEQDRLITEMFICNSLCGEDVIVAERSFLSEDDEFASFSSIESLMSSTYARESGDREFFLAYPMNNVPSVMNIEGKTSVFCHSGSSYTDFIINDSVSLSDTDDETVKSIKAITKTGNEIEIKIFLQDNVWLLQKGIYRTNPPKESDFFGRFDGMNLGSLSQLKGNILVIELFVSDRESEITSSEEKAFHDLISPALDRLAIQSADHGEKVNFVYESAYFEHENVLGNKVIDFDVMFAETGFGTLRNFAEANYTLDEYDGYFFAVCIDKDIKTSVAYYDGNEDTENYYGERILLSPKTTSREIYLSVLKMLGAYSYNEGKLDKYTESLFGFYFPTDSMLCEDIMLSEMSPVTAYSCGVTDKLDSLYRVFIPNN